MTDNDLATQVSNGTLDVQPTGPREQKETLAKPEPEKKPLMETKEPEPPKEIEGWMEKLEKGEDVQLPQPVTDDYGQTLVEAAAPQKPKITLPLDDQGIRVGLAQKVVNSVRWLAEWCLRLIKMQPERVEYQQKQEIKS